MRRLECDGLRLCVREHVAEPLAAQRGAHRREHGSEPAAGEPQAQDFGAIFAHDGDPVTGGDSGLGKRACKSR